MDVRGPKRLGGECSRDRRVDPAGHADDDVAEAVLPHVVVESELERQPHLLQLVDERRHLAGRLAAVAGRPACADVDDLHGRDLLPLARERAPADVAQTTADHFGGLDVDDQQRFFEPRRACQDRVAERDEAGIVAGARDEHLLPLAIAPHVERRRGDVDEQFRAGEGEIRRGRAGLPHVLANGRADERRAVLEQDQVAARGEVAVLVEDPVVRQEAFAIDRLDLPARKDVARVEEIAVEVGGAEQHRRAARLPCDRLDTALGRAHESRSQQQVLGWVARDREFGEEDEVGGIRLCLREAAEDQPAVALEISDDWVDLG